MIGRVLDVDGGRVTLDRNVRDSIRFADDKAQAFKDAVDAYIERQGIEAEPPGPDPDEPPLPDLHGSDELAELNLSREGVSTVIWCTGFDADWGWVEVDIFDPAGRPRHTEGVTEVPGLYLLGMPWLSARKSGILLGASDDAVRIVQHLRAHVLSA